MNFIKSLKIFFNNSGTDKLFLSLIPAFCALVSAGNTFLFDFKKGIICFISIIFFHLSIKIFDDFIDYIYENPQNRVELEQTGVRVFSAKCKHFLYDKCSPRVYFYCSLLLFTIGIILTGIINIWLSLFITAFLILFGFINYHKKFNFIISKISTESLISILCAPLCMLTIFLISAKCITFQICYLSVIIIPLTLSVLLTASLLNLKSDIITEKTTLPVIINNKNIILYLYFIFTFIPYLLVITGVYLNILPKLSLITLLLLGHSVWLFCLIWIYEKEPQKIIKWNILMGEDKYKIQNEQNNVSWYTVRFNFARNIYVTFIILLTISLINWSGTFLFSF